MVRDYVALYHLIVESFSRHDTRYNFTSRPFKSPFNNWNCLLVCSLVEYRLLLFVKRRRKNTGIQGRSGGFRVVSEESRNLSGL